MKIRKATKKDAEIISKLILKTLNRINKKDYPKKHFDFEKRNHTLAKIRNDIKSKEFICVFENKRLVGTGNLNPGEKEIERIFVKWDLIGKGVGKRILKELENKARKLKLKKLTLYPTKFAKEFYKKKGYKFKRRFIGTKNEGYPVWEYEKNLK